MTIASRDVVKRLLDVSCASLGLFGLAPVLVVVGLAIKLDSRGPVFYRQERVGRGFRPFRIFKFRSMVTNADRQGPAVTTGGDQRVTRVGRILRATKIDELPQLINVVLGDMSLVGPRPEVPKYVEMFRADYQAVLEVRPGITDLASLEFRNEEEVLARFSDPQRGYVEEVLPAKIRLAKEYVQRRSVSLDLAIIFRTLRKVVFP